MYCCSFDLRTHVGKNITRENSVGLLSLFEWNNFKFSLSFYFVKNPIFFVFSACMRLILLRCRMLFSQKRQIVCVVHITLSEEKTCLSQYIVWVFLFIPSRKNPINHLMQYLYAIVPQNARTKNLTAGESTSVQGQIQHTAAHRNDCLWF